MRSASIGNKFRADDPRSIGNLLLENNLFVDGELGPGISGNYPGPYRNVNVNLVNAALKLLGNSEGGFENIHIYDNQFQCQIYPNTLAIVEHLEGFTFERNTWFTIAQAKPFRVGAGENQREVSFEQWVAASGEKDAKFRKIDYPDSGRSIENYMRKLGYSGTDEQRYARFFAEARKMRRGAWRTEFTTRQINDYFRAGFGMDRLPLDKLPPVECGTFESTFSYRK